MNEQMISHTRPICRLHYRYYYVAPTAQYLHSIIILGTIANGYARESDRWTPIMYNVMIEQ